MQTIALIFLRKIDKLAFSKLLILYFCSRIKVLNNVLDKKMNFIYILFVNYVVKTSYFVQFFNPKKIMHEVHTV